VPIREFAHSPNAAQQDTRGMNKVLVAAASRHGSTEELAHALGSVIAGHGISVEVLRLEEVETVVPYDGLVLGSAVYMGSWLKEARRFLEQHGEAIRTRPTWLFSSGPIGDGSDEFDATELVQATGALEHHLFGGRLDRASLGPCERAIALLVHARDGDHRDWTTATAWATAIARTLTERAA
jgi:menaquinone-dependent protoporphyrinogen oxidase